MTGQRNETKMRELLDEIPEAGSTPHFAKPSMPMPVGAGEKMGKPHKHPEGWRWSVLSSDRWIASGSCNAQLCAHPTPQEALMCMRSWEIRSTLRWEHRHPVKSCELAACGRPTSSRAFVGSEIQVELTLCPSHGTDAVRIRWEARRRATGQA